MKLTAALPLAYLAAVHARSSPKEMAGPAAVMATNATGASCGVGYTYCGYILHQEKHFDVSTILTAYCAGGECNTTTGTTNTDPLQALYVCLPDGAVPRAKRGLEDDKPYSGPVKIELLCACTGEPAAGEKDVCLNPPGDHVGRCTNPCENDKSA